MSFSLEIRNGDLAFEGNAFGKVSGSAKLEQDLRCAFLTPLGFYEVWPEYGSSLDDDSSDTIIGQINWNAAASSVQSEINRILSAYQRQQIARNQYDASRFGKTTIDADETLLSTKAISMVRAQDLLFVKVELEVGAGTVTLGVPVPVS